jgi:hypothetical protein
VALEITEEGLRIELLDKENSNFFDLGSANLKPETQKLLRLIAQELGKVPNPITVEGHTDSRPYGTKTYTNWELSAEDSGLSLGQVTSVRGCADRQLRNPQDPMDFQNRRASILVRFQDKTRQEPLDLQKIQDDLHKAPKDCGPVTSPGTPAPEVSQTVTPPSPASSSVKTPPPPAGQDGPAPPRSQITSPGEGVAREPKKAGSPPAPAYKSALPPPALRLEDQVQDEVRQMLQQEGVPNLPPENTPITGKEPRLRLGW